MGVPGMFGYTMANVESIKNTLLNKQIVTRQRQMVAEQERRLLEDQAKTAQYQNAGMQGRAQPGIPAASGPVGLQLVLPPKTEPSGGSTKPVAKRSVEGQSSCC